MNSVCVGDVLACSVESDTGIFWKSSKYLFIKDIQEENFCIINSKAENRMLSKSFIQYLVSSGVLLKINNDDEKAKALLIDFGKIRKKDKMS